MKKHTIIIYCITIMVFLSLFSLWFLFTNKDTGVSITQYESPYGFTSGFGMRAATGDNTAEMSKELVLYVTNINDPITLTFNNTQTEKERQVILTLYYDYKQIEFKVAGENEYSDEYIFTIGGSKQIDIPVYLNKDLQYDGLYHKLMVSFVTGYDKQAYEFDVVENEYGITSVYDIIFDKSLMTNGAKVQESPLNIKAAENIYDFESAPLVLNTDYENVEQKKIQDHGISLPDNLLTVNKGESIDLMYNITNPNDYKNALLIVSVNYKQVLINQEDYFMIALEKESVNNGKISLTTPLDPGFYEVIGYVVYDPFKVFGDKLTGSHIAKTSYRFTLQVTD